jgi:hypothetical protein
VAQKNPNEANEWRILRVKSEKAHLQRLIRQINLEALCQLASSLRNDVKCNASFPTDDQSLRGLEYGGMNLHVDVKFEDGKTWIARFRLLRINRPPTEKVNLDRMCEVAVYQCLRGTSIPTPKVFAYGLDDDLDNPVGVGYILMEKVSGHPMDWSQATTAQKLHVFRQMKDIYLQLELVTQRSLDDRFRKQQRMVFRLQDPRFSTTILRGV